MFIVTVPTPVDGQRRPDLSPLRSACHSSRGPSSGHCFSSSVSSDFPSLVAVVVLSTAVVVIMNLVLDLVLAALDPKLRVR